MKKINIEDVKTFAFGKHNEPTACQRYGNQPYSKHLLDVLNVGRRYKHYIDEDMWNYIEAALILHDVVEDTDMTPNDLSKKFNKIVAQWVFNVTNEMGFTRKERNFKTYPKIWECDYSIFIKLCDRIANTTNSKNNKHPMYDVYYNEYPIFRYALKVRNLYPDMWKELDELNGF